jgi:hypothetical protein
MSRTPAIHRRIRAAIERVQAIHKDHKGQPLPVRGIYLDELDQAELDKAATRSWGSNAYQLGFDGHPIFKGQTSRVYLKGGAHTAVPRKLAK